MGWQEGVVRLMLQSFDWQNALETCRQVLQSDPDHLGALETMAHALWLGGEYQDVVRTTSRLLQLNPHEPGYRYTRGMAYMSLGELTRAAEDFRRALTQSRDPRFLAQVSSSLDAVELWIEEQYSRSRPGRRTLPVGLASHAGYGLSARVH